MLTSKRQLQLRHSSIILSLPLEPPPSPLRLLLPPSPAALPVVLPDRMRSAPACPLSFSVPPRPNEDTEAEASRAVAADQGLRRRSNHERGRQWRRCPDRCLGATAAAAHQVGSQSHRLWVEPVFVVSQHGNDQRQGRRRPRGSTWAGSSCCRRRSLSITSWRGSRQGLPYLERTLLLDQFIISITIS